MLAIFGLANGTKYGLGASVFGPDQTYAIQVAKQIKCGMVSVNDFGVFYVRFLGLRIGRASADREL